MDSYRWVETIQVENVIELEELMNADQVVAMGSMFWKRVMQTVHNKIMNNVVKAQFDWMVKARDERPIVSVKRKAMPEMTWKDDTLIIHAIPKSDLLNANQIHMTNFHINLDIALKFGLVKEKTGQRSTTYVIGPNLQYTLPKVTYDSSTMPTGPSYRTPYNWEGEQYEGVNYVSKPFAVVT